MNRKTLLLGLTLIGVVAAALLLHPHNRLLAQDGELAINWWSIDGGGQLSSSGGPYTLDGSIGQPDAGTHAGGSFTLAGGFLAGAPSATPTSTVTPTSTTAPTPTGTVTTTPGVDRIYLPLVTR